MNPNPPAVTFEKTVSDDVTIFLLEPAHAEEYFALIEANRKRLHRWFPWVDETKGVDDTRRFISDARRRWVESGNIVAGIRCGGRIAGFVGLEDIDARNGSAELRYWIAAEFEGRGLVTQGCSALLDHAFEDLGLHRVQIRTEPGNKRSKAVAQRLGFVFEGILRGSGRSGDRYVDHEVHSMLEDDWRARRAGN